MTSALNAPTTSKEAATMSSLPAKERAAKEAKIKAEAASRLYRRGEK